MVYCPPIPGEGESLPAVLGSTGPTQGVFRGSLVARSIIILLRLGEMLTDSECQTT